LRHVIEAGTVETEGLGAQHESAAMPRGGWRPKKNRNAAGDVISSGLCSSVSIWQRTAYERRQ